MTPVQTRSCTYGAVHAGTQPKTAVQLQTKPIMKTDPGTFRDMKLLEGHVNNAHGQALAEKEKRCSYCDAAFDTIHEL